MIALLTTARKATAGAAAAFLGPVTALFISEQEITARLVVASLLTGAVGGLTVWATGNTKPYGEHAADTSRPTLSE